MAEVAKFRFQGVAGLGLSLILGRLSQALAFVLLARFLSAQEMGQVAIFTALFIGLFQLTNLGFDRYIVFAKVADGEELDLTIDSVWSLQLVRGAIMLLLSIPIYFALLLFPQLGVSLAEVTAIAAILCLFSIATPELSSFERKGDFSFVSRAKGAGLVLGAITTIALVLMWQSPWVYLIGQMVNGAAFASLSFLYSSRVPRVRFKRAEISKVWDYSRHLILISVVSFLSMQAQNIYVGAMFGSAVLGMYFTWHRLVNLPGEFVTQIQDKLLFAKASDDSRADKDSGLVHLVGFALTVALLLPFYLYVWFHGDVLMTILATDRWVPFWWVGKMFVLIALLFNIAGTMSPLLLVKVPHITSKLRFFEAALGLALIVTLGGYYAIAGVLAALLIEISIAVIARIFLLYRYVVTIDRAFHAKTALMIVTVTCAPIILWELIARAFIAQTYFAYLSAPVFGLWAVVLGLMVFRARNRIRARLAQ